MSSKAWRVAAALASSAVLALAVGCGGDDEPEGGGAASERRRHRRDDHDVDPRGDPDPERAAGRGLQRQPREPGRADRHPDRQLPGAHRRRGRRQEPAGRLRVRRHLRAQLHLAGPVPGHHRPDRLARLRRRPGAGAHAARHLRGRQVHGPAHARPVGPVLEQGPVQEGRPRSRDAADHDERVRRARQDDPREGRRQDVRHLLRRQLPRLLRLHLLAVGVGRGRRHHERGRHGVDDRRPEHGGDVPDLQRPREGRRRRTPATRPRRARRGPASSPRATSASCRCPPPRSA